MAISILRRLPPGPVRVKLCNVLVTYRIVAGYFVQTDPAGPAIHIYEGDRWDPDVSEGDRIDLSATRLADYHGLLEVTDHDPVVIRSSGHDTAPLVQDLSGGIVPAESLESELVTVRGATVASVNDRNAVFSYGGAAGVSLRTHRAELTCAGAVIDLRAVVTEWSDNGVHQLQVYADEDITREDQAGCAQGGRPQPGDLMINEVLADPPPRESPSGGDANCDGDRDGLEDEFVEIVNVSGAPRDLTSVTLSDGTFVRHIFAEGTVLPAGGVIVVYGGGQPRCELPAEVLVVTASRGMLELNNGADVVLLSAPDDTLLLRMTYDQFNHGAQSMTLSPDLNDFDERPDHASGYRPHTLEAAARGSAYSPGTRIDGRPF